MHLDFTGCVKVGEKKQNTKKLPEPEFTNQKTHMTI